MADSGEVIVNVPSNKTMKGFEVAMYVILVLCFAALLWLAIDGVKGVFEGCESRQWLYVLSLLLNIALISTYAISNVVQLRELFALSDDSNDSEN